MRFITSIVSIAIATSCIIATSNADAAKNIRVRNALPGSLIGELEKGSSYLRSGSRKLEETESESLSDSEDSPSDSNDETETEDEDEDEDGVRRKLEETSEEEEPEEESISEDGIESSSEDGIESESLSEDESPDSMDEDGNEDPMVPMEGDRTELVQLLDYQSGATTMTRASAFVGITMAGLLILI